MTLRRTVAHAPLPSAVAVAVLVAVSVYVIAFALAPWSRDRLITEDGIIETTTALVFLSAAVAGSAVMIRSSLAKPLWAVPAFGLFGFLDEMSFGARIFGFPLPVVDGMEVDSFHDLFDLADRFAGDIGVSRTAIAAVVAASVLVAAAYLFRSGRLAQVPRWLAAHRPIALLVGALALLLAGIGLDILGSSDVATFAEETAEFGAAGLVAMAAADLVTAARRGRPVRWEAVDRRPAP